MSNELKLKAECADDLNVISAMLQDAACKVSDLSFLPKAHRFAAVMNRFMWEDGQLNKKGRRTRTGLRFEVILAVRRKNLPQSDGEQVLGLLSVTADEKDGSTTITLNFSGGGEIELQAEYIEVYLEDLSGPWKALHRPEHKLDE